MRSYRLFPAILASIILVASGARAAEPAAKPAYKTEQAILYRDRSTGDLDAYMQERCRLDIYHPVDSQGFATVVWFHGGGLSTGERFIPERLKNQGIAVIAPSYRLSPKVACPAYIEDAAAAVAWAFQNVSKFGGDPRRIFVSGHSAGGYLTAMVGLDKRWLAKHKIDANQIAGLIPFSGQMITHFAIRKEQGIADKQPTIDRFAPLFHVRADAPAMLLLTGDREKEMLGRYEENAYMARMMKINGHPQTTLFELQGYGHGMAEPGYPLLLRQIEQTPPPTPPMPIPNHGGRTS
jgi:acetyl esterase/lipase